MSIKQKNSKGLNEKKSNQGSMNTNEKGIRDEFEPEYFEVKDQDKVEENAGEQGQTSGESFDKYPEEEYKFE